MAYRLGVLVVIAGCMSATLALPPCVCMKNMKPVCGTDGITYSNKCLLDCAASTNPNIALKTLGDCDLERSKREEPLLCPCPANIDLVCGSDRKTYSNKCLLDCAASTNPEITLVKAGACDLERSKREEPLLCLCPANIDPVCGTDHKTYSNKCVLECEKKRSNVEVAHVGPCRTKREEPICPCTFELRPICGSDGQTYPNKCSLECEKQRSNVNVAYEGECRVKREDINVAEGPLCLCTEELRPVCGNNGLSYANPCLFNCAKDYSKDLQIAHEGDCKAKPVNIGESGPKDSLCNCPKDREPVCASNGLTYANECLMKCDKEDLSIAHGGPCEAIGSR